MARGQSRVVLNREALHEIDRGMATGLELLAVKVMDTVRPPDAPEIGEGLVEAAGGEIARRLPGARAAIITDENVAGAHLGQLAASLAGSGIDARALGGPEPEACLSYPQLAEIVGPDIACPEPPSPVNVD